MIRLGATLLVSALLPGMPPSSAAAASLVEEIVVTAGREPQPSLSLIGNTARIDEQHIRLRGHTHVSQLGAAATGTWLARGSEQESLPAIRSPVLTGPGSCGAFLMLEDGIPIRPAGFCNVNQLFEVPTELATAMEVVRGPANALYGANGLHGTLNFLLPAPGGQPGLAAAGEVGPDHYWRTTLRWDGVAGDDPIVAGLLLDHDSDFRADAGYDQAKGFVKLNHAIASGLLQFGLSATVLDQETAGFIEGYRTYQDEAIRRSNANPEAYRDADSQRFYARWIPAADHAWAGTDFRAYLHRSQMDFLQHFLPGQPREENGQWSGGLMLSNQRDIGERYTLMSGVDVEVTRGWLEETQSQPDTGVPVRPQGKHYDYDAWSYLAAPYAQVGIALAEDWTLQLGLRAEYMLYDYDNRMLTGNTREDGSPCAPSDCLFNRPADDSDGFFNLAPNLGLLYRISPELAAYGNLTRGFRPPQATELYRLQAQQTQADLDSETLDSAEAGLRLQTGTVRIELAAFIMKKRDFIYQDADRFNTSDGESRHRGVELQADLRLPKGFYTAFAGTWARQTYAFSAVTPGGELIQSGNDIDTAPHTLAAARLGWDGGAMLGELEWTHIGEHEIDAANAHEYRGHNLLNLRGRWRVSPDWSLMVRINNATDELYAERADFAFGNYRYFPGRDREMYLELAYGMR
jgi:outer membrane receptor protein involved in Fe transport